jgi:hypothetical protein
MIVEQDGRDLAFRAAVGSARHRVDNQAAPILDGQMARVREPRLVSVAFARQLRVRIRRRGMRVVRPRLAVEIAPVAIRPAVLPLKTLLARPRLDQRPVDSELLARHVRRCALDDAPEKITRQILVEQPVAILREADVTRQRR